MIARLLRGLRTGKRPVPFSAPRILMYHMISPRKPGATFNKLRVHPQAFEAQIRWLKESGWSFVTMRYLLENPYLPEKTVAVTFDDGYADNYTNAMPILKAHNAMATIYLVLDRHKRDWSTSKKAHHDSGELMREPKLTNNQMQEMLESGVFELGAHTLTHANLPRLAADLRRREICESKAALEAMFGTSVTSFAYPFGLYEQEDVEIVRDCGFLSAVTTDEGIDTDIHKRALELRRIKISGKDSIKHFQRRLLTGNK
jgi:peptidoglycan/xylan/chitin deacetylase (PgdA/CDA1 family)